MNIVDDDFSLSLSLCFFFLLFWRFYILGGNFDSETLAPKFWEFEALEFGPIIVVGL